MHIYKLGLVSVLLLGCACLAPAAVPDAGPDFPPFGGPPPFERGEFPPGDGNRRPPGPMQEHVKLLKQFDNNGNGYLDPSERKTAREFVAKQKAQGTGRRRMGRPGGMPENAAPPTAGRKITPAEVKNYSGSNLYDPKVLRTIFLQFDSADWEKELTDFYHTDVDVPATLTVDGKTYKNVGAHFRGASSFGMVGEGYKHSLNISMDLVDQDQRLGGYRTLDLLNSHEDSSFLRYVLFSEIARAYIPAPKANFVQVVINGESWGIYVNAQHFNKDFVNEWFGTTKGNRWKVPGSPNGRGSLAYLGDDPTAYKKIYEIKSKDKPAAWKDLINLCKILNQTSPDKLEAALAPILNIDETLRFLALDNALINNDGYWIRTSDYDLYEDDKGRFHVIPHDANETFSKPGGPGFGGRGGGPGGPRRNGNGPGNRISIKGVELDPLIALNDSNKPLLSKLLAVPTLRDRYLSYVRAIAQNWLDWDHLGPIAQQHRSLIANEVKADTRKLDSFAEFEKSLRSDNNVETTWGPGMAISLKTFAEQRRAYLLNYSPSKSQPSSAGK